MYWLQISQIMNYTNTYVDVIEKCLLRSGATASGVICQTEAHANLVVKNKCPY